jgi:hypothetical protein
VSPVVRLEAEASSVRVVILQPEQVALSQQVGVPQQVAHPRQAELPEQVVERTTIARRLMLTKSSVSS